MEAIEHRVHTVCSRYNRARIFGVAAFRSAKAISNADKLKTNVFVFNSVFAWSDDTQEANIKLFVYSADGVWVDVSRIFICSYFQYM